MSNRFSINAAELSAKLIRQTMTPARRQSHVVQDIIHRYKFILKPYIETISGNTLITEHDIGEVAMMMLQKRKPVTENFVLGFPSSLGLDNHNINVYLSSRIGNTFEARMAIIEMAERWITKHCDEQIVKHMPEATKGKNSNLPTKRKPHKMHRHQCWFKQPK